MYKLPINRQRGRYVKGDNFASENDKERVRIYTWNLRFYVYELTRAKSNCLGR